MILYRFKESASWVVLWETETSSNNTAGRLKLQLLSHFDKASVFAA